MVIILREKGSSKILSCEKCSRDKWRMMERDNLMVENRTIRISCEECAEEKIIREEEVNTIII